jgi:hypothetical protein
MSGLGIGHFYLVICDRRGEPQNEVVVVCRSGRPAKGERFAVLGTSYEVFDVEYRQDDKPSLRNYYNAHVFVRPWGASGPSNRDDDRKGRVFPTTHDGSRKVLPFSPPADATFDLLSSVILPANLVANFVTLGYRAQTSDFNNDMRVAARLLRTPAGQDLRNDLAQEFDELSRLAKQNLSLCVQLFGMHVRDAGDVGAEAQTKSGGDGAIELVIEQRDGSWVLTTAA